MNQETTIEGNKIEPHMNTTQEKKYQTTKEECQRRIDEAGRVCSGCGGIIVPIETVDNAGSPTYWPGCEECSCYDYGVEPIVFETAKDLVMNHYHVPYTHMERPADDEAYAKYWQQSQIRGTSSLVLKVLNSYNATTAHLNDPEGGKKG
jgi:hypothetical protein